MRRAILELIRLEESEQGTLGALRIDKELFCATLEPADRENAVGRSSIPAQQYRCTRHDSAKFGKTWEVADVPGRSAILFHAGNIAGHTEGCILLGQHWGKLSGDRAVLNSGATFQAFLARTADADELHLTVREEY